MVSALFKKEAIKYETNIRMALESGSVSGEPLRGSLRP